MTGNFFPTWVLKVNGLLPSSLKKEELNSSFNLSPCSMQYSYYLCDTLNDDVDGGVVGEANVMRMLWPSQSVPSQH